MPSLQTTEPGSSYRSNPVWVPDCQSPNTAPVGSAATAIPPKSPTCRAGMITWPPAPVIWSAGSSESAAR